MSSVYLELLTFSLTLSYKRYFHMSYFSQHLYPQMYVPISGNKALLRVSK